MKNGTINLSNYTLLQEIFNRRRESKTDRPVATLWSLRLPDIQYAVQNWQSKFYGFNAERMIVMVRSQRFCAKHAAVHTAIFVFLVPPPPPFFFETGIYFRRAINWSSTSGTIYQRIRKNININSSNLPTLIAHSPVQIRNSTAHEEAFRVSPVTSLVVRPLVMLIIMRSWLKYSDDSANNWCRMAAWENTRISTLEKTLSEHRRCLTYDAWRSCWASPSCH